ncbi:MAG TPA: hypothetical protein VMI34_10105 [Candidatus Bathyarchaeia archaeon]|nr:hypothetical protein [Candidatus Bathyarchaeia archaeon]
MWFDFPRFAGDALEAHVPHWEPLERDHHLSPGEAARYLGEMNHVARLGRVAYGLVWALTRLLCRSAVARHDGPVAVLRSYMPAEVAALCRQAGLSDARVIRHALLLRQCAVRARVGSRRTAPQEAARSAPFQS